MSKLLKSEMMTKEKYKFTWKVNKFTNIRSSKVTVHSQCFEFQMGQKINLPTDWKIFLETVDDSKGNIKAVGMYIGLKKKPDDVNQVNITYQFTIKNKNGDGFYRATDLTPLMDMADISMAYGYDRMIPARVLNTDLPLTDDGALIFEIYVNLYSPTTTLDLATRLQNFNDLSTKKQQSDMANLLLENWSCARAESPAKIICKDGIELRANREILAARSPVFLGMFQHDTKEAQTGMVQVKEISSAPMKVLLHFLYTGVLQDNWSSPGIVVELLYAADKYEQLDLIEFMNESLGMICTEDNVGKLANLAKKFNMIKATKDLFKFIDCSWYKVGGANSDKLERMMRDAMISDWFMVPLAEDGVSGEDECDDDGKVNNAVLDC